MMSARWGMVLVAAALLGGCATHLVVHRPPSTIRSPGAAVVMAQVPMCCLIGDDGYLDCQPVTRNSLGLGLRCAQDPEPSPATSAFDMDGPAH